MENEKNVRVIELVDMWTVFTHRLLVILLCAILGIAFAIVYNRVFVRPEYNSTATLYILKQESSGD